MNFSKILLLSNEQVNVWSEETSWYFYIYFPFEERIFITSSFTPIIFSKLSETTTCKVFL